MTEQSVRYSLAQSQIEPARTAALRDHEGDWWTYRDSAWHLVWDLGDDNGEQWFALLQKYGPIEVFRKTETKEF